MVRWPTAALEPIVAPIEQVKTRAMSAFSVNSSHSAATKFSWQLRTLPPSSRFRHDTPIQHHSKAGVLWHENAMGELFAQVDLPLLASIRQPSHSVLQYQPS
jgi:hypothetical protein